MNQRIAKLYDQSLVLESNGDYVAGELDFVKFAELIVRECAKFLKETEGPTAYECAELIKRHFGVES